MQRSPDGRVCHRPFRSSGRQPQRCAQRQTDPTTPLPSRLGSWQFPVLLGKRTIEYTKIEGSADLEPSASGFVPWRAVWAAIQSGRLTLAGQVRPGASWGARCARQAKGRAWVHGGEGCARHHGVCCPTCCEAASPNPRVTRPCLPLCQSCPLHPFGARRATRMGCCWCG